MKGVTVKYNFMAMIPDLLISHVQEVDVLYIGKHHGHNWLFDYNTIIISILIIIGHDERSRIVSVMILDLLIQDVPRA